MSDRHSPGSADAVTADPEPGEAHAAAVPRLDEQRYRVGDEQARGGLGRILLAHDRFLGRDVAVKQLLERADAGRAGRFLREALVTARLQHPSIVPVYDAGVRASGEPYYAMKLVSGKTLAQAIAAAGTLEERLALLPHVLNVADAVAYAHERGVVHRDLKPGNVLVGAFGETQVIDWGLARVLGEDDVADEQVTLADLPFTAQTRTGTVLGTPGFMPPEQARGLAVDARADVYAIGSILYTLLSGTPPHPGARAEEVLDRPPVPVQEREPGAPADLVAVVDKAMAREAGARYPSGAQLAEDLRRFTTGQMVGARRYSRSALLHRWLRRHRAAALVGTVLLAALAATATVSARQVLGARNAATAEANRLRLLQARAIMTQDPTAALAWLKTYRPEPEGLAQAVEVAAVASGMGVASDVLVVPGDPQRTCVTEDGKTVAVLTREGAMWLIDRVAHTRTPLGRLESPPLACHFSPDGRWLVASARKSPALLVNVPEWTSRPWPGGAGLERFVVTDQVAYAVDGEGQVQAVDLASGDARTIAALGEAATSLSLSADASVLMAGGVRGGVFEVELPTGRHRELAREVGPIMSVSQAATLQAWSARDLVAVRDPQGGEVWRHQFDAGGAEEAVEVAAVSGGAVFVSGIGAVLAHWQPRRGKPVVLGQGAFFKSVRVARDGSRVVWTRSDTNQVQLYDVATGQIRSLAGAATAVRDVALTASGEVLAVAYDTTTRVFDLPAATVIAQDTGQYVVVLEAWEASGEVLVATPDYAVVAVEAASGRRREIQRGVAPIWRVGSCAPGGRVVIARGDRLELHDDTSGEWRDLGPGGPAIQDLDFLGCNDLIVLRAGQLSHWDLERGVRRPLDVQGERITSVGPSRDTRRLITTSSKRVHFIDLDVDAPYPTIDLPGTSMVFKVGLSPDGRHAAVGLGDGTIIVSDFDRPEARRLGQQSGFVRNLFFLADQLVATDEGGRVTLWNLGDGSRRELGRHPARTQWAALSPSGRRLVTSDNQGGLRVWDPTTGAMAVLTGHTAPLFKTIFLDEDRLVSGDQVGWLRAWDLRRLELVPHEPEALATWLDAQTRAVLVADGEIESPLRTIP